jgi:hypothetical protein
MKVVVEMPFDRYYRLLARFEPSSHFFSKGNGARLPRCQDATLVSRAGGNSGDTIPIFLD